MKKYITPKFKAVSLEAESVLWSWSEYQNGGTPPNVGNNTVYWGQNDDGIFGYWNNKNHKGNFTPWEDPEPEQP